MVPVVKSYPHASQNSASAVLVSAQFGQGCVAGAVASGAVGAGQLEVAADPESGVEDGTIGAPHVSQ